MLFNEIYGAYYTAAAKMILAAQKGTLNEEKIRGIAAYCGTRQTPIEIEQALKTGSWTFLDGLSTTITHNPPKPWTRLELRWLKTILQDPRIRLFVDEPAIKEKIYRKHADIAAQLSDVEPLFSPEDIVYFDRYQDGDPYQDPAYIGHFHTVLRALHEKRRLAVHFTNRRGQLLYLNDLIPLHIEYADRDDKFRLYGIAEDRVYIINFGRMTSAAMTDRFFTAMDCAGRTIRKTNVEFLVRADTGTNALERAMMQFCHYRKEVTQEEPGRRYKVRMVIDATDKKDVVIQLLSFGPDVKLLSPQEMVDDIKDRIRKQAALFRDEKE